MKKRNISTFTMILVLSLLIGCSDTPTGPTPESGDNLLSNGSFERNGEPDLEGWLDTPEDSLNLTEDAPPGGGRWSLFRQAESPPQTYGLLSEPLTGHQDGDVLRLSAYVRAVGSDGGGTLGLLIGHGAYRSISRMTTTSESEWTFLGIDDTLSLTETDTIWVSLSAMPEETGVDPTGALFDLISLEKLNVTALSSYESHHTAMKPMVAPVTPRAWARSAPTRPAGDRQAVRRTR